MRKYPIIPREFRSNDLALPARNRDRTNPTDILDRIDIKSVTLRLRELLEIRNKSERTVDLEDVHTAEIREYLPLLDLIQEIEIVSLPNVNQKGVRTVISQPGLRYAQAEALVSSLLLDEAFSGLSLAERSAVLDRIRNEIKHSAEAVPGQTRHLTDGQKCADTEHRFGPITGKYVLYRGEGQNAGDIQYRNVEEYLKSLKG